MILRRHLKGAAFRQVENLDVTDSSYDAHWFQLDEAFDDQQARLDATLDVMFCDIRKADSQNRSNLEQLLLNFTGMVKNLRAMDAGANLIMTNVCIRHMDRVTRARFTDSLVDKTKAPSVEEVEKFLRAEIKTVTLSGSESRKAPKDEPRNPPKDSQPKGQKSARSHLTGASYSEKRKISCFICEDEHVISECPKFLASNDREGLLRFHKLCIYCLKHRFDWKRPCRSMAKLKCDIRLEKAQNLLFTASYQTLRSKF